MRLKYKKKRLITKKINIYLLYFRIKENKEKSEIIFSMF